MLIHYITTTKTKTLIIINQPNIITFHPCIQPVIQLGGYLWDYCWLAANIFTQYYQQTFCCKFIEQTRNSW